MMRIDNLKRICLVLAGVLLVACQNEATPAVQGQPDGSNVSGTAQPGAAPAAMPTALPTRVVTASDTVAVDGVLDLASPLISASFEDIGLVTTLNVSPGQVVKKGDVLAELSATSLTTALEKAQESLALQEAQIAKSLAPSEQTDIDTAKASLAAAYAAYNEVKAGPSSHDVESALRSYNQAKNSLYSSQLGRDRACNRPDGSWDAEAEKKAKTDPECKQADLAVEASELNVTSSYQKYLEAQEPATQEDLTKAWASVVQAQASLNSLQSGATDEETQIYDVQLAQAKLTVERAERDLEKAKLISPCDCVVQEVNMSAGATSEDATITLLDTLQLKFLTTNLTEQDVIKLQAGQTATIRLRAYEQNFSGTVNAILPLSSGTQGSLALYTAILDIDPGDAVLQPGMTGQAEINLQ
ncbi:MAG: HlyD family secretion protein [Chloroflexi bacterium]|nr:HlyD family secretion protein [Chloroflexota bacterium]